MAEFGYGTYSRLHVHTWASNREVIRIARKKINRAVRRALSHRYIRKQYYREMLRYHKQWQDICIQHRM